METFDRWLLRERIDNMIKQTDIAYIPHYWFESLEGQIYDEVRDWLNKHPFEWELAKWWCELIAHEICKHVFTELEKEKNNFYFYHLPQFITDLYHKINLEWKQ